MSGLPQLQEQAITALTMPAKANRSAGQETGALDLPCIFTKILEICCQSKK